jgi:alkylation response protein AidB-like acyl-CoA dehydrogenase
MSYQAPLQEQLFVLETIADLPGLAHFPQFSALRDDLAASILEEGGRLAADIFAPLNRKGDIEGLRWSTRGVLHPGGFAEAYVAYVEGGWGALCGHPQFGGQGLPFTLGLAFNEQLTAANMAFSLCMLLTAGAIEAIAAHGSEEQKALYLPKLISGKWTGTMNLTEPQAGSDVGALRTAATRAADGSWRIKGSKIFITWGEHELADNIVHLVLARTPGSPAGTKGISLFLVPKFIPCADGAPGIRNDVRCTSIEHKLGIHASPTCTMSFGDHDACVGWLIGAENAGMKAMFTMMNCARISVGVEGVAIAERAYQGAVAYARERVQSIPLGARAPGKIIEHPDVRRMLLSMRATTQAIRAIAYFNAAAVDRSRVERDPQLAAAARGRADLLTPITKAYATDMGVHVASLAIQVFGGVGYIEETGAAQHLRDSRIAPIYEGTNGIQALDLIGRKLRADGGAHWRSLLDEMASFNQSLPEQGTLGILRASLSSSVPLLREVAEIMATREPIVAAAGATPFLRMFGLVLGAHLLAKQALVASAKLPETRSDGEFLLAKIATAAFFCEDILPEILALRASIIHSSPQRLFAMSEEQFAI